MTARALTPFSLFALALALRLLPWPTVIEPDRVVFFGMDAWYHMRRVRLALANGGWPPGFDPYVNFPHGAQPIWPPLFDAVVGWLVWPVHVLGTPLSVERVAACLPPVLGALCVVVTWRLALRLFDPTVAWLAGLLLCFLSAHFWYSQIGFLDHHVAVALLETSLLWLAMGLLEAVVSGGALASRRAVATGAGMGASLLLWPGALLHVGVLELALGIAWMSRPDRDGARRGARLLTLANGTALVLTAPSGWSAHWAGWSQFSPAVVSHFQPWVFGALTTLSLASTGLWRTTDAGGSRGGRIAWIVGLGLGLLVVSGLLLPGLLTGAGEAWRWLTRDEVFQGLVNESKPLFLSETGFDPASAELRLSRFLYLLPVFWVALAVQAWRRPRQPALLLLVAWTFALAVVTLLQRRFFNSLSPVFAIVTAWAIVTVFRRLRAALRPGPRRVALTGAVAVLCAALFAPSLAAWRIPAGNAIRKLRGAPMIVPRNEISRRVLLDAAVWLRDNTPPTDSPLSSGARPEYGILAPWGFGHLLKYVAQRPTVVGNFGDDVGEGNLRRVAAYFASREPDAVRILDELRARYVLVQTLGDVPDARLRGEAMRKRLSVDDSPGLAHHRLLYESLLDSERMQLGRSEFRVFERVLGALVEGRAPPAAVVTARLAYQSNRGRRGRFETRAVADAAGRYALRLPYSTRGAPPGVHTEPSYGLTAASPAGVALEAGSVGEDVAPGRLVVSEAEVRSGARVAGPDFAAP